MRSHWLRLVLTTWLICLGWPLPPMLAQAPDLKAVIRTHAPDFSGTILVFRTGKPLLHESYGLANRQLQVPNRTDTKYKIASITKLFTAVIALQLHDEGKLRLHAPLSTYLPSCAGLAAVTPHQLLNHTSGMKDIVAVKSKEDGVRNGIDLYQRPYTSDAIVAKYCATAPTDTPGASFRYNNGDYMVLGKLIEAVDAQPFEAVLARRILGPLRLTHTGMLYQHAIVPGLASTYFARETGSTVLSNDLPVYDENFYAAGAMYSTATDLAAFTAALFGGKLLKPASELLLRQPGLDKYGYGAWIYEDLMGGRKYTAVMRPGQIMGTNTVLYRVVEAGLTVIILSNTDASNVDALAFEISKALLR